MKYAKNKVVTATFSCWYSYF